MNRLILIGNGFDLAHGLKTDYNSFILWYLNKCLTVACNNSCLGRNYQDELLAVDYNYPGYSFGAKGAIESISYLVDHYYEKGMNHLFKDDQLYIIKGYVHRNPFKVTVKSNFFDELIHKCTNANWVDIENEFYDKLKELLNVEHPRRVTLLEKLNNDLEVIKRELEEYLLTIKCEKYSPSYSSIFNSSVNLSEILYRNLKVYHGPVNSMILNFNYTSTIEKYLKKNDDLPHISIPIDVNYIHGRINDSNNKIIFGFGDELDEDYKKMELSKDNGFFEHIKSFGYFKTSNYHNLIRFIESDEYQIYILGHSCGLSDRTMLNMIFEHTNCRSIKIYYHGTTEKNNYIRLTQEISRHFRDKVAMRSKIVPFDKSFPMPQIE
ncbi:MAG TPA: AbiH family protein [Mucilaginibacter sp.]